MPGTQPRTKPQGNKQLGNLGGLALLALSATITPMFGQIDISGSWLAYNESDALSSKDHRSVRLPSRYHHGGKIGKYLAEPYCLTRVFKLDPVASIRAVDPPCIQGYEGVPEEAVPHFYPGKNELVGEITKKYNVPEEAYMGGSETMYPEFRKKIKDKYQIPEKCPTACGGPGGFGLRGQ